MHRLQDLVRHHRQGIGCREIARLLGMSPNTERQYRQALQAAALLAGDANAVPELEVLKAAVAQHLPRMLPPQQVSTLEEWVDVVTGLLTKGAGPRAVYDRLKLDHPGFAGTYSAVKRLCRRIKKARGVRPEDVAIPVETRPGEVAQVDFGYVGRLFDPQTQTLRKAWVFVLVLGHSRHMVARVVFDQRVETWLWCHAEAFAELGGVPETVVPDNLKSAVVRAAFGLGDNPALNRSYREFARHYGFKVDPAPPFQPKKKGKVESGVGYVKHNFFVARSGCSVELVRPELKKWVYEVAGTREHGTTGRRPLEVFEREERAALRPLPQAPWETVEWREVKVHRDSHVAFDRRLYSVPWRLVGQKLWLRANKSTVVVFADDVRAATHERNGKDFRSTKDEHLPVHRADLRHRSRAYWEDRAAKVGPEAAAFVKEVFDSDEVLSLLRTVQAVVTHLEGFPKERAEAACRRARYFGTYSYPGVKNILKKALDFEPLPLALMLSPTPELPNPRFARNINELLHLTTKEDVPHEPH